MSFTKRLVDSEVEKQDRGLVFDIERFSTKDGPGIRTVVFFKGCNMDCFWCHNPESINLKPQLEYDETKCIACSSCVEACRRNALSVQSNVLIIDRSLCNECFDCVDACYSGALQRIGTEMTVSDILSEVLEDKIFYEGSGGGVTLSGGEVMMQSIFAAKLLEACKNEGIHTALDSNMSGNWSLFEEVLPFTDLVMADIKCMDDAAHKEAVGVSNKKVLENIKLVAERGTSLIVRTPVIPGFNDTKDNIRSTAEFVKTLDSLMYYELLAYHPLGESKAKKIGLVDRRKIRIPTREEMNELATEGLLAEIKVVINGIEKKQRGIK
ncbi:MAG: glycyl-radical enzyme activating protein [Candidatus Electryonea clarkiae]|nr:glycyl-radical enzyme activating protein [Candidatus Electryonea clarkiae]